jgi:hypothetical protein
MVWQVCHNVAVPFAAEAEFAMPISQSLIPLTLTTKIPLPLEGGVVITFTNHLLNLRWYQTRLETPHS